MSFSQYYRLADLTIEIFVREWPGADKTEEIFQDSLLRLMGQTARNVSLVGWMMDFWG